MSGREHLLTDAGGLRDACERLSGADVLAVDTEFVRDRTYFGRLCLLQVASPDEHVLVDTLAITDLSPLRALLLSPRVLKVFHSGRQDLELFHDLWGVVPAPVFDTQLAATILGHGDQVAYGALVREVLGIDLDKAHALTDWARRPLSDEQLAYAAADVTHLVSLYHHVRSELETRGRADWLTADLAALTDPRRYAADPGQAWESVKGGGSLRGSQRGILREIAAWREGEARARDLPRRWILSDEHLVAIARRAPQDAADLDEVRGLPERFVRQSGSDIVVLVQAGLALPPDERPPEPRGRLSEDARAITDLFASLVRQRARDHDVSASFLAPRAELEQVAVLGAEAATPLLEGWRRSLVGEDLLALRDGRARLSVNDGRVSVEPAGRPDALESETP